MWLEGEARKETEMGEGASGLDHRPRRCSFSMAASSPVAVARAAAVPCAGERGPLQCRLVAQTGTHGGGQRGLARTPRWQECVEAADTGSAGE